MNNKQSKRRRDIKTKLMAAICMLLVSSIMMVSTTYAWFTLSTAPEVTGINTAVGANGNLEMALVPSDGLLSSIDSTAGDSMLEALERNITWGNLVDLQDDAYGLDNITLYPAALNVDATDPNKINTTNMLKTPTYGADGRIYSLEANTLTGGWSVGDASFLPSDTYRGVRAVGNASGMTPRQLSFRSARAAANSARSAALTQATQSLNTNGSALASIAIKRATDKTATYTQDELADLLAIVTDLNKSGGIIDQIETAYLQYILAYAASNVNTAGDEVWSAINGLVSAEDATAKGVMDTISANDEYNLNLNALSAAVTALEATKSKVATANTKLTALVGQGDDLKWEDGLSEAVAQLADMDGMLVNGIPAREVQEKINDLFDAYLADGGLILTMGEGGGVYTEIADHCGDFEAGITIAKLVYGNFNLTDVPARMKTDSNLTPDNYLVAIRTGITDSMAPSSGDTVKPLTDMFGYVIDLAFRTNAAESNLLLEIDGTDRIYGDENAPGVEIGEDSTWGNGSSMTFKANSPQFSDDQVKGLMAAVRIVFFDPTSGNVQATAKLDTATATNGADGWTAKMYLYTTTGDVETKLDDTALMPLTQNTATALSVLVYLDGDSVGNDDVAFDVEKSVTGSMNLQFASSANLVPMEYTPLQNQDGSASTETTGTNESTPESTPATGG